MPEALLIRDPKALVAWAEARHRDNERIALVPTMGYLHEGHLSLVRAARKRPCRIVASIFVNPTQFGPKEDLSRYPVDFEGDFGKLSSAGVDAVFAPEPAAMYPNGFDTYVVPGELAKGLCGASRPGHFRGVATVVHMLFQLSRADVAYFGEKDFQQLAIIKRMAKDLWLPVEVVGCPIVREPDGLAMSSRNVYLSPDERRQALILSQALARAEHAFAGGERRAEALIASARTVIDSASSARIDYMDLVDAESLRPVSEIVREAVMALAVFIGKTRLIDNRRLNPAS